MQNCDLMQVKFNKISIVKQYNLFNTQKRMNFRRKQKTKSENALKFINYLKNLKLKKKE